MVSFRFVSRKGHKASFTLVELLIVIAIIAILAALTLAAGNGVYAKSARNRASAEMQAMSTGLEGYKTDNGIYPPYNSATFTTNYTTSDPAATGSSADYTLSAETLYQALSGQTNYLDTTGIGKSYMAFKTTQLGNATAAAGTSGAGLTTYAQDPFRQPYGYNTGSTANSPYNGYGFFDLWSTGGKFGVTPSNTNSWIANWQ